MRRLALPLALCAAPLKAEETRLFDDEAISDLLTGTTVVYEGARQIFHTSGVTDYITDRPSQGRWAARAGQYCSTWPPSDTWACYDVLTREEDGKTWVIWIGSDRSRSEGLIVNGKD